MKEGNHLFVWRGPGQALAGDEQNVPQRGQFLAGDSVYTNR